MKAKALIMVVFIAGLVVTSNAQTKTIKTRTQPTAFSPVTKGYYAIGKNIEKLNTAPSGLTVQETEREAEATKGYYAIGRNNDKIRSQQVIQQDGEALQSAPAKRSWPVKGYYGIGNNAEKLK